MKFNTNSPLMHFLARLADLMILNFAFIVTSLPLVTIGASWTAMYYVSFRIYKNEEKGILRDYFHSFKENIKSATAVWMTVLLAGVVIGLDFFLLGNMENSKTVSVMKSLLCVAAILILMEVHYVFPQLARYTNSLKSTLKNAALLSVGNLPKTVVMLIFTMTLIVLTFVNEYTFTIGILIWLMFGFAMVNYTNACFFIRIFQKIFPSENSEDAEDAE